MKEITEGMLTELRAAVAAHMSQKRFCHTLAVESMTERLCAVLCPEQTMKMRAAALLHDVTKEKNAEEQIALCEQYGLTVTEADRLAPKTLHARTAAAVIPIEFADFADPLVLSAVRWHTTGRADMTLPEKILYLADYIDDSRTYESCVRLRHHFWDTDPAVCDMETRLANLRRTLILSYDLTIADLIERGKTVATDTIEARNFLILEARREERK